MQLNRLWETVRVRHRAAQVDVDNLRVLLGSVPRCLAGRAVRDALYSDRRGIRNRAVASVGCECWGQGSYRTGGLVWR